MKRAAGTRNNMAAIRSREAYVALVLSVLSVTTAAAQTAFTGVNVIGCKSPSDLASYHALLADAMKAVPMKPEPDSEEELEQMVAAREKFAAWLNAHERDGSCYFFAADTKVVIDQQAVRRPVCAPPAKRHGFCIVTFVIGSEPGRL
jgi:hypothetical protein